MRCSLLIKIVNGSSWNAVFFSNRPENTHKGVTGGYQADLNMVYWSKEGR